MAKHIVVESESSCFFNIIQVYCCPGLFLAITGINVENWLIFFLKMIQGDPYFTNFGTLYNFSHF